MPATSFTPWPRIPPSERCPICEHRGGWCLRSPDGAMIICPLAWLAIAAVGRSPVTVVLLFTAFSIAVSMWTVVALSTRQRLIPR